MRQWDKRNQRGVMNSRMFFANNVGARLRIPAGPMAGILYRNINRINSLNLGANAGNGKGTDCQFMGIHSFTSVRLIHANYNTAASMVINRCAVAPAAISLTPNGNTLSWSSNVTWSGVSNVTIAAATAGTQTIPSYVISDPVSVTSIARTDGGTYPILRVRTHHNDSSIVNSPAAADVTAANAASFNPGFKYGSASFSSTSSALLTTSSAVVEAGGVMNPVAVIFTYASPGYSLAAFGDSLSQAVGSTGTTNGWPQRLMFEALSAGLDLQTANFASSGRKHADYVADATNFIATYHPSMAAIFAWSVNDGTTQGVFDACWTRTTTFISACVAAGVTPVIVTSPPSQGTTWSRIAAQNALTMALPSYVIKVDAATALGDGGATPVLQAQYDNGDGVHWSEAGSLKVGQVALAAIRASAGI